MENGAHGAFFCTPVQGNHRNVIEYNPATMRVLGTDANGNLAFIKAYGVQYIPANTAFIKVSEGAAEVFYVVEQEAQHKKGDLNNDGEVDIFDYNIVNQMVNGLIPETMDGDINGDGIVNIADIFAILNLIAQS